MDSLYDGILIADKNTIVKYVNDSYSRITGVKKNEIIGKKVKDIRPGARLPNVIKSGKKMLRVPRKENNSTYIVNMSPIKNKGEIVGGISVVRGLSDVHKLQEKLKRSNMVIKKYKNHVKSIYEAKYTFESIIGKDEKTKKIKNLAKRFSKKNSTILIKGESGTGKELYAQAIHNYSERSDEPFIAINCATLNSNLLESELFGYEEGTFTDAKKGGKLGMFEAADKGTFFLDEITEMSCELQAKLLRTLQEKTIRRIGGLKEIDIDVRVIAATNKNIENLIEKNKFRKDLYYRLNVIPLVIPPLRDRRNDIKALAQYYLNRLMNKQKRHLELEEQLSEILYNYSWPGNVRELFNALEFAANMTESTLIRYKHLPKRIQETINDSIKNEDKISPLKKVVMQAEKKEIEKALKKFGDTVSGKEKAAEALNISIATLYNKINNISKNL